MGIRGTVYATQHAAYVENVAQITREGHDPRDPEDPHHDPPRSRPGPPSSARPSVDSVTLSVEAQAAFAASQAKDEQEAHAELARELAAKDERAAIRPRTPKPP